ERHAMWRGEGGCQERARARCRSGASLLRAALEQGAAAGAQVATVMGHARPDPINVRDVLLTEPHRIRFAGRALLRGPLLRRCGRRRERERTAQERGRERGGGHRPELRLCDTNFHYRPSSWCSAPVCTVNPLGMASSHAGDGDPSKNRGSVDRVTVANCRRCPPFLPLACCGRHLSPQAGRGLETAALRSRKLNTGG